MQSVILHASLKTTVGVSPEPFPCKRYPVGTIIDPTQTPIQVAMTLDHRAIILTTPDFQEYRIDVAAFLKDAISSVILGGKVAPRPARDVLPGQSWAFSEHRTVAELSDDERKH
jgi:hypothetical protein